MEGRKTSVWRKGALAWRLKIEAQGGCSSGGKGKVEQMISEREMMLAQNWNWHNVVGWYATPKLWDARCYWDGKTFWSRGGLEINAPDRFKAGLPDCAIDGGVYCGHGKRHEAAAIDAVSHGRFPATAKFAVYDAPDAGGNYFERIGAAADLIAGLPNAFAVKPARITSTKRLAEMVRDVLANGGEGLMLHSHKREYIRARTSEMLKLKMNIPEYLYQ